jgi:hypothetical protein
MQRQGISSRAPVVWGWWQGDSEQYELTDGDVRYCASPAQVCVLRLRGASVTCYGGPLDHRNPTAHHGAYDAEIAALREATS